MQQKARLPLLISSRGASQRKPANPAFLEKFALQTAKPGLQGAKELRCLGERFNSGGRLEPCHCVEAIAPAHSGKKTSPQRLRALEANGIINR